MNIIHIVDSEGGALKPLASLLKQHFAYYKVSYFDTAEEVFAELQGGVCPSLLIVGLPAINEQSVMLMVEARRFWPTLPILVTAAWGASAPPPVFEGFKFVALDKLETSPVAHAAGMLFGAERMSTPGDDNDDSLTLSDVLQLHAIQKSTGSLRFGGRSRARVSLAGGLPVTAKAGNRKGKKALTRLLRRSSLKRCIFDPEPPEEHEFEISFEELFQLFTRPSDAAGSGAANVVEDVDEIDAKDLLEEGGIETLLTLDSRPTLERIEETMRLLMSRDSVSEKLDSIKLHTPLSEESGELASLVESYELASGLDEETAAADELDAEELIEKTRDKGVASDKGVVSESAEKALPKPSLADIKPPQNPYDAEGMNKKATLFISHDLIAAAAGDRDDSEWSDASEVSEVSEALESSEVSESSVASEAADASLPVDDGHEELPKDDPEEEDPTAKVDRSVVQAILQAKSGNDVPEVTPDEDVEDAGGDVEAKDDEVVPSDVVEEDTADEPEDVVEGAPEEVVEASDAEEILLEDEADEEPVDDQTEDEQSDEPDAGIEEEASDEGVGDESSQEPLEQGDEVDADAEDAAIEAEDDELAEQSEEAVDTGDANQVEPGESDLDGAAAEFRKDAVTAEFDNSILAEQLRERESEETLEGPADDVEEEVVSESLADAGVDEDEDDDLMFPQFKLNKGDDRNAFAQEVTAKKTSLPAQLLAADARPEKTLTALDVTEEVAPDDPGALDEDAEDVSELAAGSSAVVVEPYEEEHEDDLVLGEIDEDLSEASLAEDEAEGTFELVDEVEPDEDVEDAGGDVEAKDDEVESSDVVEEDTADEPEDVVEGAPEEVVEASDAEEILLEDEADEEPDEEPGTPGSDEPDVDEGTVEVDEDAILSEYTDEHLPDDDGDGKSTLTGSPMATYPMNNPEEPEDPWADLAKEVAEPPSPPEPPTPPVPDIKAPGSDGEQEAATSEPDADAEDRDLSRRLRAGAKDLLRHLKPPSGQPPTPEAFSLGGRKSPSDPEQFPREESEEGGFGLEQITRAVDDDESFSDIVIEELEQGDALRHERSLDDQLSTVDRPLAVDLPALDMAGSTTDTDQTRSRLINQELIDTAEQPAVQRPHEASSSELDVDFGESWDLLGDGLSESISDSLGFSSVVEEISMAEVVSVEEVETNEYARQDAPPASSSEETGGAESVVVPEVVAEVSELEDSVILEDDTASSDAVASVAGDEPAKGASGDNASAIPEDVATAVREALETLQGVPGLVAVALVDTDAEACFDFLRIDQVETATAWPAEEMVTSAAMSIRAQRDLLAGLGQSAAFEDVLFAVGSQHYILRPLDPEARWMLGLLEYTPRSNIALTRLLLGNACTALGEILESIMNIPASASRKTPTRA